jgi:hypothetical protein
VSEAGAAGQPETSSLTAPPDVEPAVGGAGAPGLTPAGDRSAEAVATGDPRVDDAVSRLAEVDALPLAEQVEVFTDIHRRLAAVLADPDSRG